MEPDRWLGVELRHLAALQAIAQEGSFGRAAARLGYTQSAISQQIATLERIVGERLVDRPGGPRRVALTEAGQLLLRHADAIVARLEAAQADLAALSAGEAGSLRVGTYQSVGARLLPTLMRRFRDEWPGVEIRLSEHSNDVVLLEAVERGDLDLTFMIYPLFDAPLESQELMRDPYVLVVPADSPLVGRATPPKLREIAELPLIGFRQCRSLQQVLDHFRARGYDPQIVFQSDDNGTVQGLVGAGVGCALVPRLTVDEHDERTAVLEVGEKLPPRVIGIAWHRDRYRSPAAHAFVEAAAETARAFERPVRAAA